MKKSSLKKKSKFSQAKLERELWQLCRKVAEKRSKLSYGVIYCFTCGNGPLEGSNRQLGHFIPKSVCGAYLKYDLRNLRFQCFRCNINAGGNGAEFYKRLVEKEGQEYVDALFNDKQKITKAVDRYIELKLLYEQEL